MRRRPALAPAALSEHVPERLDDDGAWERTLAFLDEYLREGTAAD